MSTRIKELNETFAKLLESCPELVFIGNPVLREKAEEVSLEEGLIIGEQLKSVLKRYREIAGFGRGLAAPQIGAKKAVFVTFVDDVFKIYINPRITSSSEKYNLYRESCLSCGFISADVKRPISIELEYMNEAGVLVKERIDSFLARLIQHECDHLEGVVNIDCAEAGSIEMMINNPLEEKIREY